MVSAGKYVVLVCIEMVVLYIKTCLKQTLVCIGHSPSENKLTLILHH